MSISILNEQDYYRIVYGGWLGKNIGGTLGAPVEGKKELLSLDFYPVLQDGPLENDDLDLQLVWLHALEQYGPQLTCRELGQEWAEHIFFPFDEYGYALTNLRRGITAPLAGAFNNPFTHCMGSPIRSEIWAMAAPGAPHVAAHYAYQDAIVDHAGGEGVYGEMFFAAIESAIFKESNRDTLIETGLAYIPPASRTALAVRDLLRWHQEGKSWTEARALILEHHGSDNFTDAPQNIAFTILGWLYGEDFEDAILKAVNCGYDTDCTAATLGAILGMLAGPERLPEKWVSPVGDRVVVSPPIKGFPAPENLDELTRRTIRMGKQVLAAWDTGILVHPDLPTRFTEAASDAGKEIQALWERDVLLDRRLLPQNSVRLSGLELIIDYGEKGPAIARQERKAIRLQLANHSLAPWEGELELELPADWKPLAPQRYRLAPGEITELVFAVEAPAAAAPVYEMSVVVHRTHDGSPWSSWKETFALIAASEWVLAGPDGEQRAASFGGNRIAWEEGNTGIEDGRYEAGTTLINPRERRMRLIVAANCEVTARLNGEIVIDCRQDEEFMPAYHRAPESQRIDLTLPAGSHKLEITAQKKGEPLEIYVLPVATAQTAEPGPYYYHTDIMFLAEVKK